MPRHLRGSLTSNSAPGAAGSAKDGTSARMRVPPLRLAVGDEIRPWIADAHDQRRGAPPRAKKLRTAAPR